MNANQLKIPVIQAPDPMLVQIQQNVNKVFTNLYNQFLGVKTTVDGSQGIGDVEFSALGLKQYQAVHGKEWIEANGQSSVGTAYQALTTLLVVPNITLAGANAYIKVN